MTRCNKSHKYSLGSFLQGGNIENGVYTSGLFKGMNTDMVNGLGAATNIAGTMANKAISGGYSSNAGNVISGLGTIASAIPGPYGAAISTGLNLIGGLTNRAFGSKLNQEKINEVNNAVTNANSFKADADSFDSLTDLYNTNSKVGAFSQSDIGEDGWFSNKAKKKYNKLKEQRELANAFIDRSIDNNADNLITDQGIESLANYAAFGGPLHTNGTDWNTGITVVGNGGTHEQNPLEGVPMGIAPDGQLNLVEEGEVIFNDYVFSKRLQVPKDIKERYKLRGENLTFADAAKKAQKESAERPNDPISKRGLESIMGALAQSQEMLRQEEEMKRTKKYARGGKLGIRYDGEGDKPNLMQVAPFYVASTYDTPHINTWEENHPETVGLPSPVRQTATTLLKDDIPYKRTSPLNQNTDKGDWITNLRYAPVIGSAISVASDLAGLTNKPDYGAIDSMVNAANSAPIGNVRYNPIGTYLKYIPFDRNFYSNKLMASSAGARRALINNSGSNRGTAMAGILASDYNTQRSLGDLFRQAEEYNAAQREKVATFNRSTDMFNTEQDLKTQMANQSYRNANTELRLNTLARAAAMKDAIDNRISTARSANLTNLFDNLGNVGREAVMTSLINKNPGFLYGIGLNGIGVPYKRAKGGCLRKRK